MNKKPNMTETKRNRKGRYDFTNMDQLCRCGQTLGQHTAEWPHDLDEAGKTCEGFKKTKQGIAEVR